MRFTTVATTLVVGLTLVSCSESEKPKERPPQGFLEQLHGAQPQFSPNYSNTQTATVAPARQPNLGGPSLSPAASTAAPAPVEPAVQIPKEARWTLYCASIAGPDRFARAAQMKAYLTAKSPFKDWYIVHNEADSTLFYGFYAAVEKSTRESDPMLARAAAKAHQDRTAIMEWKDEAGERPFLTCFFTPITPANPVAPPEWSLSNVPEKFYWSVQIAAFKDNPKRKEAAVELVKELRDKGVDAYYFHGRSISSVCVGVWPADALKQQDIDGSQAIADENDAIMVTDAPLPDRFKNARLKTNDGQRIVPYAQRVEIADKSLQMTMKEYPYHFVNYEPVMQKLKAADGSQKPTPAPSFLVKIPREEASMLNPGSGGVQDFLSPGSAARRAADTSRQPAGTGRLRSLDGK